jgi:Skp family chaperone for outer membrane proteins
MTDKQAKTAKTVAMAILGALALIGGAGGTVGLVSNDTIAATYATKVELAAESEKVRDRVESRLDKMDEKLDAILKEQRDAEREWYRNGERRLSANP